jgi:hypothetical protein
VSQQSPPSAHAEQGQAGGGVILCAVCGDEADGSCGACDVPLCGEHLRTTAVPGDSFCRPGEGCYREPGTVLDIDPVKAYALAAEVEAQWAALQDHPVAGPFLRGFRIPLIDEEP